MYRDCARQVGAFLGKLRPCALPQRALHLAQLLWRYLVNSSAVTNYGSHPVHFSWRPPRCSPSASHFLSCHLSTDNVGCLDCRTDVLPALFKISSVFLRAQIMLLLTLALLRFSEQNLQFFFRNMIPTETTAIWCCYGNRSFYLVESGICWNIKFDKNSCSLLQRRDKCSPYLAV